MLISAALPIAKKRLVTLDAGAPVIEAAKLFEAKGVLYAYDDVRLETPAAVIPVDVDGEEWTQAESTLRVRGERSPLFFLYRGNGALDLYSFTLHEGSVDHGVGPSTGTKAERWIKHAVDFWDEQTIR